MEEKTIREPIKEIQVRFFTALDMLIESNQITGIAGFCRDYNLNRPKYTNLRNYIKDETKRKPKSYRLIDIDALLYLVKDYGISARWLITGRGGMFDNK